MINRIKRNPVCLAQPAKNEAAECVQVVDPQDQVILSATTQYPGNSQPEMIQVMKNRRSLMSSLPPQKFLPARFNISKTGIVNGSAYQRVKYIVVRDGIFLQVPEQG